MPRLSTWSGRLPALLLACLLALTSLAHAGPPQDIEAALAILKRLPETERSRALLAHLIAEGHWRFLNAKGEVVTASNREEVKRAIATLLPEAGFEGGRNLSQLALFLTDETAVSAGAKLAELPREAALLVIVASAAYAVDRQTVAGAERLFARSNASLLVEIKDLVSLRETFWQLSRPLSGSGLRLIALEPGLEVSKSPAPSRKPAAGEINAIDPANLKVALAALKGETAVLTGRIADDMLWYQPRNGPRRSLALDELSRIAEAADANVIVLETRSTKQPGTRNWLFLSRGFKGLTPSLAAGQEAATGDLIAAFAAVQGNFVVRVLEHPGGRFALTAMPAKMVDVKPGEERRGIKSYWQGALSVFTGDMVVEKIWMTAKSRARQGELDVRIVPGLPSWLQLTYAALIASGFLGLPTAWAWYGRLWPAEDRAEYANRVGYLAAEGFRRALFAGLFLPLSGPLALPVQIVRSASSTLFASRQAKKSAAPEETGPQRNPA
ncbi:MAG: hypothetical protein F9K44_14555 [Hyphomicrobiaceae bacterium]|nr:MAG: hypothetical protein F9K44_14555 [Hyphomicrobiaceae bacterium]